VAGLSGLPIVAVVGRPNVGKSTLFNRIVGARTAVVEDRAHTTRDRLYGDAEWNGRRFVVVDTGGLDAAPVSGVIEVKVQEQARLAIGQADVIVFVVDAPAGLTPADREAADILRTAKAPVLVAANKADNQKRELDAAEFYELGWEETYPIAALHGRGVADLLDAVVWALPPESAEEVARKERERAAEEWARDVAAGAIEPIVVGERDDELEGAEDEELAAAEAGARRWDALIASESEDNDVAIAIVGRPNVGKSSLLNSLLGEERAIVSDVPGTTRDAIDTVVSWGRSQLVLIDTAGVRRRGRVASGPAADKFATLRALRAVQRADVAILVIDAVEGLTAQDAHIAGYVVEEGRGLLVVVNKWDLLTEKTDRTFDQYVDWMRKQAPFLDFAPVISISAKTGQRVDRVLESAVDTWGERRKRVSTGELNRLVSDASDRQTPPMVKGRRPKLFYATQVAVAPPTFVFFARDAGSVHFSYRRYLENRLREAFGFDGTPIRIVFRERSSVQLEKRRSAAKEKSAGAGGGYSASSRTRGGRSGRSGASVGKGGGGKGAGATNASSAKARKR
jgi:GTP-binding protein